MAHSGRPIATEFLTLPDQVSRIFEHIKIQKTNHS